MGAGVRYFPVFLDLVDQPCIVIGDGKLAAEKAAGLREGGAQVRTMAAREYRPGALAGARLVVDASDDPDINRQTWDEAEAAGILINVVDRPAQCRFIAPAIVRRDPLVIAVSTSGESPFLASAVRARLERWLGREWGPFTALVGRIRQDLRRRGVPLDAQTRVYRRLLASDVRDLLHAGRSEAAEMRAVALAQAGERTTGRVALVGAGPGDPRLLTVAAREMLADADYVLHDALISPEMLAQCGSHTIMEDAGKRGGRNSRSQPEITARLIELARDGHFVVRLKGGDPFVFGRGGEELRDLAAAGIDVVVVPGITSALAAPAAIGVPATMRGLASSIAITTGQGGDVLRRVHDLALAGDTLIVLMARANLGEVAAAIARAVGPSRPAALVSKATWSDQRQVIGVVGDIARLADHDGVEAPATLVVGEVVALGAERVLELAAAL